MEKLRVLIFTVCVIIFLFKPKHLEKLNIVHENNLKEFHVITIRMIHL